MKRHRGVMGIALLVCGALTGTALAIDYAGLVKEAQARHAKFRAEVRDMTMQQVMENVTDRGKMSSQMTVYLKGDKTRADVQTDLGPGAPANMRSMQTVVIGDGTYYWLVSPMMGTQKLPQEEGEKYRSNWEWWDRMTTEVRVVGEEKVNGRTCHVVEGKSKQGSPFSKLWIDKQTFLLVKAEGTAGATAERMSILCSDFHTVHRDFEIPYRTDVFVGGKLSSTTRVTSVKVNTGLADDLFDPKKVKVKGPSMKEWMQMMEREQP
ncbi:MAG: outer membrane lipoprotein-sorting protein [candidate division KSB1 bacterium]|nr:outer membrane lipoprotein-sorting protein [candidate division KSB1 bacterium]MDZ7393213.1 outer membrane lipoprotein-sorting protein [candidate division KSB1 bacterium]MDZ7413640.1 outer membrane lipoprotein-sorting protein [candidate division KSB1 bacterium]